EAGHQELIAAMREFAKSCWENSGVLLQHISTLDTVNDLDLLRTLVGDKKLFYLGYSYGTAIGAAYAEVFGANVSRLVLDAAVDIAEDSDVIQAQGFDTALGNFAAWCAQSNRCTLGVTQDEVVQNLYNWLEKLGSKPVKVGERYLTQSLATAGIGTFLYAGKEGWDLLVLAVAQAQAGQGDYLLLAGDMLNGREPDGSYSSLFYAFSAISCLDYSDKGLAAAALEWERDKEKAPFFGRFFGPDYLCPVWPVQPIPDATITAPNAGPILVIGGTGDNATPYQQAVNMASQLKSGVLVTYDGEGHGTFGGKSKCVDDIVINYFVEGRLPSNGVVCT
ncbi:MAG: alpha/beta hydrolase, partial [Propionibacteriaceae bacterium]|nr:alpha/beta hydrolase [Propionibacteriaceae bacterium]